MSKNNMFDNVKEMNNNVLLGYARVSSEEQAQHGISISAQRDILRAYATMHQTTIEIYEDPGFSGKNTNRPAMQEMLRRCQAGGVSSVVVWKLDRLSRSLRDTLTIIEDIFQPQQITLVSVTESIDTSTPSGRMMLNLLASFAQLEREQDSDRVVMAHKHLARDCRYLGGHVPLGYCIDDQKYYQLDPVRAPIVRRVFDMYIGRAGYAQILAYINGPDVFPLTGKGKPFRKSDISMMVINPIYAGNYVRKIGADPRHRVTAPETITVPGGVPALITAAEAERVSQIRAENAAAIALYVTKTVYPLTGLVYCAVCGGRMRVNHGGKTRAGKIEKYYECRNRCVRQARVEHTEAAVFSALEYFDQHPKTLRDSCAVANTYAAGMTQENAEAIRQHEGQILSNNKKAAKITAYIKKYGADAPRALMDELRAIEKDTARLRDKIAALSQPVAQYDAELTIKAVSAAVEKIKNAPPDQLKALIQAAVDRVTIFPDSYEIRLLWYTYGGDDPPHNVQHIPPKMYAVHRIPRAGQSNYLEKSSRKRLYNSTI